MRARNRCIVFLLAAVLLLSALPVTKAAETVTYTCDAETRYAETVQEAAQIRPDFYSTLSTASKTVYDSLLANLVSLRDGKTEVTFSFPKTVSYEDLSVTMYQDAMNAFNRDHSEVFWLDMATMKLTAAQTEDGYMKGKIEPVGDTYYTAAYSSAAEVERDIALMEARIDEITSAAAELDTIYERLLYIHDWLTSNNVCNSSGIFSHMRAFEAVSALEGNQTGESQPVCEGYARAFKLLCDELGIPCILITGEGSSGGVTESHMWNYVKLDGAWYAVDVTWDDPIYLEDQGEPRHAYFLIGSATVCDEGMLFTQNHREVKKLSTHGSDIVYPVLSEQAYLSQDTAESGSMESFSYDRTYESGIFSDVESRAWYEDGVSLAYRLGLMSGTGDGRFHVAGMVTVAEALTMAARIHAAYYGNESEPQPVGNWYDGYVEYAFAHNIIRRQYPDYNAAISRAGFAEIFAKVLPEMEFGAIREVEDGAVPDLASDADFADAAYLLYRAGILIGNDRGEFQPDACISRGEVALIVARIVDSSLRVAQ